MIDFEKDMTITVLKTLKPQKAVKEPQTFQLYIIGSEITVKQSGN